MNLRSKVKQGLKWTFVDQVISQLIFLIFGIFLARILSPSIFGVVSIITIFSSFASLFIDFGFGITLVQKKDTTNEHFSSVFWFNLVIGILLYIFFFFLAPFFSLFYKQPELTALVRIVTLSFIINSLTAVQSNLLVKDMKFRKKSIFNWIAMSFGYFVAFWLALNGFGVWSIVWMTITTATVNSVLYWFSSTWRPSFIFNWNKISELSKVSIHVVGESSINYWSRNLDNFIISRYLGNTELGIYTRAYSLMLLPLRNISSVISKVMFPAFSKKHDEILIIKMHYLRIVKYIATVTFPIMLGLAFVSKEFVLIFFGEKWKGMIPILSILSGIGAIQSILSLNGLIYNSLAKNRIAFKVSIVVNIVLVVSFFIGIQFGLIGLTWSYFIASLLIFIPTYHIAISQINTSLMEVYCVLKGLIFATSGVAIVLLVSNYYFSFSLVLSLALKCSFSVFIYILLLFVFEKSYTKQLIFQAFKIIKNTK